jgi:DNA-binding MarR family transcriptional regulator
VAAARRKQQPSTPDTITDPVQWASHYWKKQGIEGDERRFLAMTSLLRFERIVVDVAEGELKKFGLNMTDYLLLMTLQLSETGTRLISSLARNLLVHATTATLATDRLEAKKMLFRSPHPSDRRATCVTITDEGRETIYKATKALSDVNFGLGEVNSTTLDRFTTVLAAMRDAAGDTKSS